MRIMELEKNVKYGHLSFFQRDISNLLCENDPWLHFKDVKQ